MSFLTPQTPQQSGASFSPVPCNVMHVNGKRKASLSSQAACKRLKTLSHVSYHGNSNTRIFDHDDSGFTVGSISNGDKCILLTQQACCASCWMCNDYEHVKFKTCHECLSAGTSECVYVGLNCILGNSCMFRDLRRSYVRLLTRENIESNPGPFRKNCCDWEFDDEEQFEHHVFQCSTAKGNFKAGLATADCYFCPLKFTSMPELNRHVFLKHNIPCWLCLKSYTAGTEHKCPVKKFNLKEKAVYQNQQEKNNKKPKPKKDNVKCKYCNKVVKSKMTENDWKEHEPLCIQPLKCVKCGYTTRCKDKFSVHWETRHEKEEQVPDKKNDIFDGVDDLGDEYEEQPMQVDDAEHAAGMIEAMRKIAGNDEPEPLFDGDQNPQPAAVPIPVQQPKPNLPLIQPGGKFISFSHPNPNIQESQFLRKFSINLLKVFGSIAGLYLDMKAMNLFNFCTNNLVNLARCFFLKPDITVNYSKWGTILLGSYGTYQLVKTAHASIRDFYKIQKHSGIVGAFKILTEAHKVHWTRIKEVPVIADRHDAHSSRDISRNAHMVHYKVTSYTAGGSVGVSHVASEGWHETDMFVSEELATEAMCMRNFTNLESLGLAKTRIDQFIQNCSIVGLDRKVMRSVYVDTAAFVYGQYLSIVKLKQQRLGFLPPQ